MRWNKIYRYDLNTGTSTQLLCHDQRLHAGLELTGGTFFHWLRRLSRSMSDVSTGGPLALTGRSQHRRGLILSRSNYAPALLEWEGDTVASVLAGFLHGTVVLKIDPNRKVHGLPNSCLEGIMRLHRLSR